MGGFVCTEVRPTIEAFPTDGTFVRLLPRVDSLVPEEFGGLAEALPAVRAGEGFLPRVDPLVPHQLGQLVEALTATEAQEGLCSLVSYLMPNKVRSRAESSPALCTFMNFLFHMGPLVSVQFGLFDEAFPTL